MVSAGRTRFLQEMVQPSLSNYCVSLKHAFPALLVPSAQGTFPQLLSGGKVPLTSPFPNSKQSHKPTKLQWSTYFTVLRIRQLSLGHQGARRWPWVSAPCLLLILSGWLLMRNAIMYVYKTESYLRPAVSEASATKPASLSSKREAKWIQDEIQA